MSRKHFTFFLGFIYLCLASLYIFNPIWLIASPPAGDLSAFIRELDNRIPHFLQASHVPGASVALIQHGQVVWAKGYGMADIQQGLPVSAQTLFQAASVSKTATAWGVMKLVEDGTLALDAPAESYLTRWHLPPSEFDSNEVTIRRLLSHTSGIAAADYLGYPPDQPLPSLEESLTNGPPALAGRMNDFPGTRFSGGTRLVAPPGDGYIYSDSNFLLLQLIVEEATGQTFADYMQRAVLTPLGMADSSFARTPELVARTASPYDAYGKPLPDFAFTELAPAGLYTTASDLARLVASAFPGPNGEPAGRGLLSPDSVRLMTSPTISIPGFDSWIYADAYGLGYFIETLPDGERLISHSGGNLGWVSEYSAIPSTGDGLVIMTNGSVGHAVYAETLTAWTDWLGRGETHVAHAILMARRVFQTLSFSMLVAAAILLTRLMVGIRSGARRFHLARLPRIRVMGAALCVVALVAYWMVGHPWMQIDIPSPAAGMLWGVNLLCLTLFANFLVAQNP
jgi:CubicO group peptidase (beta-lactamase class C family)